MMINQNMQQVTMVSELLSDFLDFINKKQEFMDYLKEKQELRNPSKEKENVPEHNNNV